MLFKVGKSWGSIGIDYQRQIFNSQFKIGLETSGKEVRIGHLRPFRPL